jgi:PAS domain-containing protein
MDSISEFALISSVCLSSTLIVMWLVSYLPSSHARGFGPNGLTGMSDDAPVFLFLNGRLIDATPSGNELLGDADPDDDDWLRLADVFSIRFPDFPREIPGEGKLQLQSLRPDDLGMAEINAREGVVRVSISGDPPSSRADRHRTRTARIERDILREAVNLAPFPVWKCDAHGRILWSNTEYRRLASRAAAPEVGSVLSPGLPLPQDSAPQSSRVRMACRSNDTVNTRWFDVTVVRSGHQWLHYASDITPVVMAEIAQRNFVQTLTKTFAQLSIGLAIFDRNRSLALFNPALIELTSLSPEFLSGRPGLLAFFDCLRDRQVMPEPKDYASWRDQITELVDRAVDGRYQETWSISPGVTFRVTGRPHPDGAIAFLFEDISAEVSLTRGYRQQIEIGRAALDSLEQGIAIFSAPGALVFCNAAYRALWGIAPGDSLAEVTAIEATAHWQAGCSATPVWGEVRDFVGAFGPRSEWQSDVTRNDGSVLTCRCSPLGGGATLVEFAPAQIARIPELASAG